jgi:hypothetical protein
MRTAKGLAIDAIERAQDSLLDARIAGQVDEALALEVNRSLEAAKVKLLDAPLPAGFGRTAARTVTVRKAGRRGERVTLHFSALPDREFGPYPWPDAVTDLTVSALLSRPAARDLVLDALATGEATAETGERQ